MKQIFIRLVIIILFAFDNCSLQGQSCSSSSTLTPNAIFYPSTITNYTAIPHILYLCGPNTIVFDTTTASPSCRYALLSPSTTLTIVNSCPMKNVIWVKNNATLIIKAGGITVYQVFSEPGATIIDFTGTVTTLTCSPFTFPTINCTAGITDIKNKFTILNISPNPNNGTFNLKLENQIENGELMLMNSLGQKVFEQKITQGENNIFTIGLAKGLYHCVLLQNKQLISSGKLAID